MTTTAVAASAMYGLSTRRLASLIVRLRCDEPHHNGRLGSSRDRRRSRAAPPPAGRDTQSPSSVPCRRLRRRDGRGGAEQEVARRLHGPDEGLRVEAQPQKHDDRDREHDDLPSRQGLGAP